MNKMKLFSALLIIATTLTVLSCSGPTIRTTTSWVNKDKMPAGPIKSVFIIAFTDNREARVNLENNLAEAAEKKGIKAYKSIAVIGPVDMKEIAPVKEVFMKKLEDLNCETIFTVALVRSTSETKYVPGYTSNYSPYYYGNYASNVGYGNYGPYGGFGGYYGFCVGNLSSPGYYSTNNKYFIEAKLFDLKSDTLLLSIQSKATNPGRIEKSSKQYTETLMEEFKNLRKRMQQK
jgi:hypothetical protein